MALNSYTTNSSGAGGYKKKTDQEKLLEAYYANQQPEEGYIYNNPSNVARLNNLRDRVGTNGTNYYTTVGMPSFQTYSPTAFTGYQTYNPTDFSGWQTYQDNPYQGYQDFQYDPFSYQDFSYNYQDDPLYQMYAEQYTRRGQQSMDDTMAQIAARTGGVASSYSQAAAQNSYNSYMADLAAKIPELQQIARKMYDTDRNFAYDQYRDQRDVDYQNYLRGYQEDYNNWQNTNAINQANVDLANNYAYNNWQNRENANKYNVDTANQYAYASWQLQEAARQAAVNQANDAAMQQWAYQQQTANNNAQARLSAANANYEAQLKALQDQLKGNGTSGGTTSSNWKPETKQIRYDLIDNAVKYGKDETSLDAMANEYINAGFMNKTEYNQIKKEIMNMPLDSLVAEKNIRGSVRAAR